MAGRSMLSGRFEPAAVRPEVPRPTKGKPRVGIHASIFKKPRKRRAPPKLMWPVGFDLATLRNRLSIKPVSH
ncbi:hypothetical protein RGAI101_2978 [Roseobacter sp. GAI101]|nr:hypothetical protein RGAI101_2978 [Roseobacter sp. GAI101]